MDWSVVVHAYGNPLQSNWQLRQPYQAYTFSDLGYVTQFQQSWLRNLSVPNPAIAPQAMLAASEQGWDTGSANQSRTLPTPVSLSRKLRTQNSILKAVLQAAAWTVHERSDLPGEHVSPLIDHRTSKGKN